MKYMLLIYSNPESWASLTEEGREWLRREHIALDRRLRESGELAGGEALADPSNTRTVRVRDGVPATTDGPFVESKEHLAGYYVVECETPERAAEIAATIPDAQINAVEVRPVIDAPGPN